MQIHRFKQIGCLALAVMMVFLAVGCKPDEDMDTFRFVDVAIGPGGIIAVDSDGNIWKTHSDQEDVKPTLENLSVWENVVDVAAGGRSILALLEDGTVAYDNVPVDDRILADATYPLFDLSDWNDITDVACGSYIDHVAGLRSDGTVVVESYREDIVGADQIRTWTDIKAIAAGQDTVFGLRSDGTVVASSYSYIASREGVYGFVDDWRDITAIDADQRIVAGLRSDGTVVLGGINKIRYGAEEIATWKNIIDVDVSFFMTAGLTEQGTVLLAWNLINPGPAMDELLQQVQSWTDVVDVTLFNQSHLVAGLKSDGTILLATTENSEYHETFSQQIDAWNELVVQE